MRVIAVACLLCFFALPIIIYCIFAICGRGGNLFKGYWHKCTNIKENNTKENKYVIRIYGIKNLILFVIFFAAIICLIYEQWIAGIVLSASVLIVWGIIELVLLRCKKYQQCKREISDEKRQEEYWGRIVAEKDKSKKSNDLTIEDNNINQDK